MNPEAYRYPREHLILTLTLLAVLAIIVISASATFCSSAVFVVFMVGFAYLSTRVMHSDLVEKAQPVTAEKTPGLLALVEDCRARLGAIPVQTFVVARPALNAYTFGLTDPKVVVIYNPLLKFMDGDELKFVIGHELGHVMLGHTWLNSVMGGMAGIPSPAGALVILHFAFRWWSRACEFSADRAGLLACGRLDKAITALACIGTGRPIRSADHAEKAIAHLDAQDEDWLQLFGEALSTHPLIIRRITALREFAASPAYQQLRQQAEARSAARTA